MSREKRQSRSGEKRALGGFRCECGAAFKLACHLGNHQKSCRRKRRAAGEFTPLPERDDEGEKGEATSDPWPGQALGQKDGGAPAANLDPCATLPRGAASRDTMF